jgi:phosphoserine phosphatase
MKHNGAITVLVSGGFTFLTNYLKDKLGFDFVHANYLQYFTDETGKMLLNGKKALKEVADLHFEYTNLLGLLYAQGYSDSEIIY